jgi:hypothetical protein
VHHVFRHRPGEQRRGLHLVLAGVVFAAAAAVWSIGAHAAPIDVTNTLDSGAGSLRAAITNANAGDTIVFTTGGTITLASELPVINKNITIDGNGFNPTISGAGTYRPFFIGTAGTGSPATVTIANLTITNAVAQGGTGFGAGAGAGLGGAIFVSSNGALTLTNVAVSNTQANGGSVQSNTQVGGGGGMGGTTSPGTTPGGGGGLFVGSNSPGFNGGGPNGGAGNNVGSGSATGGAGGFASGGGGASGPGPATGGAGGFGCGGARPTQAAPARRLARAVLAVAAAQVPPSAETAALVAAGALVSRAELEGRAGSVPATELWSSTTAVAAASVPAARSSSRAAAPCQFRAARPRLAAASPGGRAARVEMAVRRLDRASSSRAPSGRRARSASVLGPNPSPTSSPITSAPAGRTLAAVPTRRTRAAA